FCYPALLRSPRSTLFPYTTLFRSSSHSRSYSRSYSSSKSSSSTTSSAYGSKSSSRSTNSMSSSDSGILSLFIIPPPIDQKSSLRSEEHTSELQSRENLVCRLLLEK